MKFKAVVGILLVIVSVAGMFLWETRLRDKLVLDDVIVASRDISEGEIVDETCFCYAKVVSGSELNNSLSSDEIRSIYGLVCTRAVYAGEQIVAERFKSAESLIPKDTHKMVIPGSWVYLSNSELKIGDCVQVYKLPEKTYLGEYEITLVTDSSFEIRCYLDDFYLLYDLIPVDTKNTNVLLFVLDEEMDSEKLNHQNELIREQTLQADPDAEALYEGV